MKRLVRRLLQSAELDLLAEMLGTRRFRWFWIFRESDEDLRARLERRMRWG